MADEILSDEDVKKLKNLTSTVIDLFMKLAPVSPAFKQVHKLGKEMDKVSKLLTETSFSGRLPSTDDNLNKLANVASGLSSELSKLARQDENYWLEVSGANLFSKRDSTRALTLLTQQRQHLVALSEACSGLKVLAGVILTASNANLKGLAKAFIPGLLLVDVKSMVETQDAFDVCKDLIATTLVKLERAINVTADMAKAIDQAIVLFNNSDQREAARALGGGAGRSQ